MTNNVTAFLDMLAISEGTSDIGDNGYNVLVGSTLHYPHLFSSYADHPRIKVWIQSINTYSSAAGRYQIIENTFDFYKEKLGLKDFSPASQDAIATEIIKEHSSITDIESGHIENAIYKLSSQWASLPGNNYGQHENKLSDLEDAYLDSGGMLAS